MTSEAFWAEVDAMPRDEQIAVAVRILEAVPGQELEPSDQELTEVRAALREPDEHPERFMALDESLAWLRKQSL
jgi:hypothetical protein